MPDFSQKSKFNKEANFTSILFGADAPLLEVELNELQSILLEKIRDSVRAGFKDGVINSGEVTYDGSKFTMKDFLVVVDGDIFFVSSLTIPVSNGQKIYLTVEEEEVNYQSTLKKYGNRQETNIVNHMLDVRVNQETSRRQVLTYNLTTSKPKKGIEIGEIINGEFKVTYSKSKIGAKESIGKEKPTDGSLIWYEEI